MLKIEKYAKATYHLNERINVGLRLIEMLAQTRWSLTIQLKPVDFRTELYSPSYFSFCQGPVWLWSRTQPDRKRATLSYSRPNIVTNSDINSFT